MNFKTYDEGGDSQLFVSVENTGTSVNVTVRENEFVFTGFGNGIHPYHKKQMAWVSEVLRSKGIHLNLIEVPTVSDMGVSEEDADAGEFTEETIKVANDYGTKSHDGNVYVLIQDTEMGRGWTVLIKIVNGKKYILTQDHRDTVLDDLIDGDFIKSFDIDYGRETVKNLAKIKSKLLGKK